MSGVELAHPGDLDALRAAIMRSDGTTRRRARAEVRLRPPRRHVALVRRDRHRPHRTTRASAGWVANLRDITERKAQEAALNEAQEAFRHAFDDAPIGIGLVGLDGRIQRANRAMARAARPHAGRARRDSASAT